VTEIGTERLIMRGRREAAAWLLNYRDELDRDGYGF
jgi:hypothetical protein